MDEWRESQGGYVSRAEAVRSLVDRGLEQAKQPKFSDGEKLITLMLWELFDHLKIKGGVRHELHLFGHLWGALLGFRLGASGRVPRPRGQARHGERSR